MNPLHRLHPVLWTLALALATPASAQCKLNRLLAGPGLGQPGDQLGRAVAVSGSTVVAGAWADDDAGNESGSAYVFERVGVVWHRTVKLTASDGSAGDRFGFAVDATGDVLVVGAYREDANGNPDAGSVYVYERQTNGTPDDPLDDTWLEKKLTASDGTALDEFGHDVAIDGERIVVGARQDDEVFGNSGSVYIFERVAGIWVETQKLTAGAGNAGATDQLGFSVSISGDWIVAGSHRDDDFATNGGTVYVFQDTTPSALAGWVLRRKFGPSDPDVDDEFGTSVSNAGDTIVVGAWLDDDGGSEAGSVYVFERDDQGTPSNFADDVWVETRKLVDPGGQAGDRFGFGLALSDVFATPERQFLAIGSYRDDDVFNNAGSLFIYHRDTKGTATKLDDDWLFDGKLFARADQDEFGIAVDIEGDELVAGAQFDNSDGTNAGAAWIASASGEDFLSLSGEQVVLSGTAGGSQALELNTCVEGAGSLYLILGSFQAAPGFDLAGFHIPLNVDSYFTFTVRMPNSPVLNPSLATLDAEGRASATFSLPPGSVGAIGGKIWHAYGVFQGGLAFVSNGVFVDVGP